MQNLDKIRIVLIEPAGARNVGSIARVMANMGLQQLDGFLHGMGVKVRLEHLLN